VEVSGQLHVPLHPGEKKKLVKFVSSALLRYVAVLALYAFKKSNNLVSIMLRFSCVMMQHKTCHKLTACLLAHSMLQDIL
jgi:hypothetical protein